MRQKEGTKRRNKSGDREVIYRQKRLKNGLRRRRHRRKNRRRESNRKRLKDEIDKYRENRRQAIEKSQKEDTRL